MLLQVPRYAGFTGYGDGQGGGEVGDLQLGGCRVGLGGQGVSR